MRRRGDGWRSIISYLDNEAGKETADKVFKRLKELSDQGEVIPVEPHQKKVNAGRIIIAGIVIGLGIFLIEYLWDSGWIAMAPVIMIFGALKLAYEEFV